MNRWSIPAFVDASAFASAYYERELIDMAKNRSKTNFAAFVGMATICMALGIAVSLMEKVKWEGLFAACAISLVLMISINAIREYAIEAFSARRDNYEWRLRQAKHLLANSIYFGDEQKMWWKIRSEGKDPREEVYTWCASNGIAATLASYDDPMFGQFGMLVSMPDDESMIFFKLKYMDKI